MIKAYLTIDDIPSANTPAILTYLKEKNIHPVMFTSDAFTRTYHEHLIEAIRSGVIVGNHSLSHGHMSEMTLEEAITEIEKEETLLNQAYAEAGVERKVKLFRFPFLDKGGKNKEAIQEYLRSHGFTKLKDTELSAKSYYESGRDQDIDVTCSYDVAEYMLPSAYGTWKMFHAEEKKLDLEDVKRKMVIPDHTGSCLIEENGVHIVDL